MLFALLLLAGIADWVPMRWTSSDPAALEQLSGTPVNCILIEKDQWSPKLIEAARSRQIATAALIRPSTAAAAKEAAGLSVDAVVLEGDFEGAVVEQVKSSGRTVIELPSRARIRFDAKHVVGTHEGVWPGIHADEGGSTKSAPSGAPWIFTNSGFLRFARAAAPDAAVWIANTPPEKTVLTGEHYMQAIADAAIVGARWVLAFDADWMKRFYARDEAVLKDWKRIVQLLAYFNGRKEWQSMRPLSRLALVQDVESGALLSGGVLDMIAVKHTPVLTVPSRKLSPDAMTNVKMAVNVDPSSLSAEQKEALRAFARSGGTTLTGPGTWKFPSPKPGQITLSDNDVKTLDEIWREVNTMTGRRNLGARLFNVSSMLSNLLESADGKQAVLHLVNYSGYPVENVTVHLLGKYKTATLIGPGAEPRKLDLYEVEEGMGVDVPSVGVLASLVLE
jgi:hypothetical protein